MVVLNFIHGKGWLYSLMRTYVTFIQCSEVRTRGNKAKGIASCLVDFEFCLCGSRARYEARASSAVLQ